MPSFLGFENLFSIYIHIYISIYVESNLGDGSFDLLPSDPSLAYYQIVKDWGTKWVNKGEITQPLLDCILNVGAKPSKNYRLIKTHKPNN